MSAAQLTCTGVRPTCWSRQHKLDFGELLAGPPTLGELFAALTPNRGLAPDLLILDDFGLRRLTAQQSNDLYELIIERHRR